MNAGAMLPLAWRGERISLPVIEAARSPWIAIIGNDSKITCGPRAYDGERLRRLAALARGLAVHSGAAAVQHCAAS